MKNSGAYMAFAVMWFSTAIAVSVGIYITHSPWCLWAFILPSGYSIKGEK